MRKPKWKGPKHRCSYCDGTRGRFVEMPAGRFTVYIHERCYLRIQEEIANKERSTT